jgi:hypothetical protein
MILLSGASESLAISKAVNTTTTDPDTYAVFIAQTSGQSVLSDQRAQITGTGDITVLSAPSSQTTRKVRYMTLFNRDTITHDFDVKHIVSGVVRQVAAFTLLTGEWAEYTDDGWDTFDSSGVPR